MCGIPDPEKLKCNIVIETNNDSRFMVSIINGEIIPDDNTKILKINENDNKQNDLTFINDIVKINNTRILYTGKGKIKINLIKDSKIQILIISTVTLDIIFHDIIKTNLPQGSFGYLFKDYKGFIEEVNEPIQEEETIKEVEVIESIQEVEEPIKEKEVKDSHQEVEELLKEKDVIDPLKVKEVVELLKEKEVNEPIQEKDVVEPIQEKEVIETNQEEIKENNKEDEVNMIIEEAINEKVIKSNEKVIISDKEIESNDHKAYQNRIFNSFEDNNEFLFLDNNFDMDIINTKQQTFDHYPSTFDFPPTHSKHHNIFCSKKKQKKNNLEDIKIIPNDKGFKFSYHNEILTLRKKNNIIYICQNQHVLAFFNDIGGYPALKLPNDIYINKINDYNELLLTSEYGSRLVNDEYLRKDFEYLSNNDINKKIEDLISIESKKIEDRFRNLLNIKQNDEFKSIRRELSNNEDEIRISRDENNNNIKRIAELERKVILLENNKKDMQVELDKLKNKQIELDKNNSFNNMPLFNPYQLQNYTNFDPLLFQNNNMNYNLPSTTTRTVSNITPKQQQQPVVANTRNTSIVNRSPKQVSPQKHNEQNITIVPNLYGELKKYDGKLPPETKKSKEAKNKKF